MNHGIMKNLQEGFNSPKEAPDFHQLLIACKSFFEAVNTPTSLAMWMLLENQEYEQYLDYSINPQNYLEPKKFRFDYQCVKMFSKAEFFPSVYNTKVEAQAKFIQCEASCRALNRSIENTGFLSRFERDDERQVIYLATRKISRILGTAPTLSDIAGSFGPGLSVGLSNNRCSVIDKLKSKPTITKALYDEVRRSGLRYPAWEGAFLKDAPSGDVCQLNWYDVVPGSRLTFVPKTAKTDRPICVEPLFNGFIQKGIGAHIKRRLKSVGCNLFDQTLNQRLAKHGALTNSLATIDLSSASDTISYNVVLYMLPFDWFELLDVTRSPNFTFEGRVYPLEKFSSMGNAYTFELESLIFLSVARSVCNYLKLPTNQVNVYGDDIIVPAASYELLTRVLKQLGFEVNLDKSFATGPFRESCGADYFLGSQVRPLFLKKTPTPAVLIGWCNHIRRNAGPNFGHVYYAEWWRNLKNLVPKRFHALKGPDGQGDGHFVVPFEEYSGNRYHSNLKKGWEGYGFYTITSKPLVYRDDGTVNWTYALYKAQFTTTFLGHLPKGFVFLHSCGYSHLKFADGSTAAEPYYPKGWEGFVVQRDCVRPHLTKAFSIWKDVCVWL